MFFQVWESLYYALVLVVTGEDKSKKKVVCVREREAWNSGRIIGSSKWKTTWRSWGLSYPSSPFLYLSFIVLLMYRAFHTCSRSELPLNLFFLYIFSLNLTPLYDLSIFLFLSSSTGINICLLYNLTRSWIVSHFVHLCSPLNFSPHFLQPHLFLVVRSQVFFIDFNTSVRSFVWLYTMVVLPICFCFFIFGVSGSAYVYHD